MESEHCLEGKREGRADSWTAGTEGSLGSFCGAMVEEGSFCEGTIGSWELMQEEDCVSTVGRLAQDGGEGSEGVGGE